MKLKDKVWLWGQTAGSHHFSGGYNLPGENKMSPVEGAEFFGIKNLFLVKTYMDAVKNINIFSEENAQKLSSMNQIIFSVLGTGSCDSKNLDTNNLISLAKTNKKIVGGVMDDFISEERVKLYTPSYLRSLREELSQKAGRPLELWSVFYERDILSDTSSKLAKYGKAYCGGFKDEVPSRAAEFDGITFWTWFGEHLKNYEQNYAAARSIVQNSQKFMLGVYFYDYGNSKPIESELMDLQLDFVYKKLISGEIDGIVICSNCIIDIGLSAVNQLKLWIDTHGDEEIPNNNK